MKKRVEIIRAIVDGSLTIEEGALALDATEDTVRGWLDQHAFYLALGEHEMEARKASQALAKPAHKGVSRRTVAVAMVATALVAGLLSGPAVAQVCSQVPAASGVLATFCAGQPVRAADINHNFATVRDWIQAKVGNVGTAGVTTSSVTTSSVTSTGDSTTGGYLRVQQGADFQCSNCGSIDAFRGSDDWGRLTIQGRVISANNNIHISPPAGTSVVIDSHFRAAGGSRNGSVGLSVSGNLGVGANTWGATTGASTSSTPQSTEPTGDGWSRQNQCNHRQSWMCPNGTYVCGVETFIGCGWQWYDQGLRVQCCSL